MKCMPWGRFAILLVAALCAACRLRNSAPDEGVLISVPYELETLDPHLRNTASDFAINAHFYEPLVSADTQLRMRPCLAESWDNPDALTWIFQLRPSATFHDGKPLKARDVVYTFRRLMASTTLEMRARASNVADVKAIDAGQVLVRTRGPLGAFLNQISFILIVPDGFNPVGVARTENGTGPYVLKEWKAGDSIQMARFDGYWGEPPAMKRVSFSLARTAEEALTDVKSGRYQLVHCNDKRLVPLAGGYGSYDIKIRESIFAKYLSYDVSRDETPYCDARPNPFKNPLVRRALNVGIDRARLVAGLSTAAIPAGQPIPQFVFGHDPTLTVPVYDPQEARVLLRQAGYPDGFAVTLHTRQMLQQTAELIREQLAGIGVRVSVKALGDPDFFSALDRRDATFFVSRFGCVTGDASDVLEVCMHSLDASGRYGTVNYGDYSNPVVDRAIEESSRAPNPEARQRRIQQIMGILVDELPWISLYFDQEVYAVDQRLSWQPRSDSYIFAREIGLRER